jgi:DNA repair exonuclease SbcCD nuclease subunit
MKLAFVTDTHFGYRRFEEDAYRQGREAILSAAKEADALILGGDNFDVPIPRLETLAQVSSIIREALAIFRSRGISGIPIYAIHGNHDRRARGFVGPAELLAQSGLLVNFHNRTVVHEANGENVALSGLGNVPEDLAREGIAKMQCKPVTGAFNVFVLHQSFQEFDIAKNEQFITFDDLPEGFDLYLCGHVHKPSLSGKVLNPGSTVVTQLRADEAGERGWLLYDTKERRGEFKPVSARKLIHSVLELENASPEEVRKKVEAEAKRLVRESGDARTLVKLVVKGTLAQGFGSADIQLPSLGENVFVDNAISSEGLKQRLELIKQAREKKLSTQQQGMEILRKKLEGTTYSLGDPEALFESLLEGTALKEIREKIQESATPVSREPEVRKIEKKESTF